MNTLRNIILNNNNMSTPRKIDPFCVEGSETDKLNRIIELDGNNENPISEEELARVAQQTKRILDSHQ